MKQKVFLNTLVTIITLIIIAGAVKLFLIYKIENPVTTVTTDTTQNETLNNTLIVGTPSLSKDKKSIVVANTVLVSIDTDEIFNWFKNKSQLCDGYNLTSNPDRKAFCENKVSFKSQTRFSSIVISPDKTDIGFTIESDTLSPDTVAGIFSPSTHSINLLTNYYIGNEFISFSPSGKYFVYQGNCWEGLCGLFIKNSETLTEETLINNPEYVDLRSSNATFIKWISDNTIEYKIGSEIKQESW